jgi:hypothetical protein
MYDTTEIRYKLISCSVYYWALLRINIRSWRQNFKLLDNCFMLVSCLAYLSTLKIEATCSTETYDDFQCSTLRYTPENKTSDHRGEWPAQAPRVLPPVKYMFFSHCSITLLNYFAYFVGSYIIEWWNDNEWWIWEHAEWPWPVLSHYTCIRIAGLRNTTKSYIRTADVATEVRTWDLADKKQDGEPLYRDARYRQYPMQWTEMSRQEITTRPIEFTPVDRGLLCWQDLFRGLPQFFQVNITVIYKICMIWGFYSGDYEECRLLECGAV